MLLYSSTGSQDDRHSSLAAKQAPRVTSYLRCLCDELNLPRGTSVTPRLLARPVLLTLHHGKVCLHIQHKSRLNDLHPTIYGKIKANDFSTSIHYSYCSGMPDEILPMFRGNDARRPWHYLTTTTSTSLGNASHAPGVWKGKHPGQHPSPQFTLRKERINEARH
ncbi:hypothetical protein E2C01_030268 [Portunus trituberculatus]|uniref:Uncharacterized protein n=1 Tax=Portunus trituberculatus TaxID=210409 RepID=A0A5B7EQF5_PORTR|nr:hypothetical protein [Portunus trituberculatus]